MRWRAISFWFSCVVFVSSALKNVGITKWLPCQHSDPVDCRSVPGKKGGYAALKLDVCSPSAHNRPTTRITVLAGPLQCTHQRSGRSETKWTQQDRSCEGRFLGKRFHQQISLHPSLSRRNFSLEATAGDKLPRLAENLHEVAQHRRVVMPWVPSHCGLPRYDTADEIAKHGAKGRQQNNSVTFQ